MAANDAQDGTFTIGVAAHICAASAGGPRFDPCQTAVQRSESENGIWLCQNCGRLIDADPRKYPVETLRTWKAEAQKRALKDLLSERTQGSLASTAPLGLSDAHSDGSSDTAEIFVRVQAAARLNLQAQKEATSWPNHHIDLNLSQIEDPTAVPFPISRLHLAMEMVNRIILVAPPGMGKTTTVLQLAEYALGVGAVVPIYIHLGDWSAGSVGLLQDVLGRPAFRSFKENHLISLARDGRLLLLLDGWNELDLASQKRLRIEITTLCQAPLNMQFVVTTRLQAAEVPMNGMKIGLNQLSEDQQMELARAQLGAPGERIVDTAWRIAGVRELIATPLYLSALLTKGSDQAIPSTKEGLLQLFVTQHERTGAHSEAVRGILDGCHAKILADLARALNDEGSTTLTDSAARGLISASLRRLEQEGQIADKPRIGDVLDVLTGHHLLVRSPSREAVYFHHQQFQEWFAASFVVDTMRDAAKNVSTARERLRVEILDRPSWEESVLFAVERLCRESGGHSAVANAIREGLSIDPLLAAEMIYRATPEAWDLIKSEVTEFIVKWHSPGTMDRAVSFILIAGKPDFASTIWSFILEAQPGLPRLRITPRFRHGVLGHDLATVLPRLSVAQRRQVLDLLAGDGDMDAMDLAVSIAKSEPSPEIQAEVIQHLFFRHADRHAAALLSSASTDVWSILSSRDYADEVSDPVIAAQLRQIRSHMLETAPAADRRLRWLLEQAPDSPDWELRVIGTLAAHDYPTDHMHVNGSLAEAARRAPLAFLKAMAGRAAQGLALPSGIGELLAALDPTDDRSVASIVLDFTKLDHRASILSVAAGPETVCALIERFLERSSRARTASDRHSQWQTANLIRERIGLTHQHLFLDGVLRIGMTADLDTISDLSRLVTLHGDIDERRAPLVVDCARRAQIISAVRHWANEVLSPRNTSRHRLADVAGVVGRLAMPELVPDLERLLAEDLSRHQIAREGRQAAILGGDLAASSDAAMNYGNIFRGALISIGSDAAIDVASRFLAHPGFAEEASWVLKHLSDGRESPVILPFRSEWPRFDIVAEARKRRTTIVLPQPKTELAERIFIEVERLLAADADEKRQLRAIQLTAVAMRMPHSNHDALVERVMALPRMPAAKLGLLTAMALDGVLLKSAILLEAIRFWLEDSPEATWHKRQHTWEIEPWLELLPYSDEPDQLIDAFSRVAAFYGAGHYHRFERVVSAIAYMPGEAGEKLMLRFARAYPDAVRADDWVRYFMRRSTVSSALGFVDLYLGGDVPMKREGADPWYTARSLAPLASGSPEFLAALRARYSVALPGRGTEMLECLFGEVCDEECLLAMIESYARRGKCYDGRMRRVVEALSTVRQPAAGGSGIIYIDPAPVASMRRTLFELVGGSCPSKSRLAAACLAETDRQRDDHGFAGDDRRHPNVLSGCPWPQLSPMDRPD